MENLVDEEVHRLIDDAHAEVRLLLSEHRDQLNALAQALLDHETLGQDEAYAAAGLAIPAEPLSHEPALR